MFGNVGVHRMDERDVVHALRYLGKNVTHPLSALAILFEAERRGHETHFGVPQRLAVHDVRTFARVFGQHWLVVEGIHLRWTARHEELDESLRFRCEMRQLWRERRHLLRGDGIAAEHGCESDSSDAGSHFGEGFSAGKVALGGEAVSEFVLEKFHDITVLV